jgi:hypothetical protein
MATVTYGNNKDIRLFPEVCVEIPCIIGGAGVSAGTDGRKVVKAGTPVGSATNVFEDRQTVLTANDTNAIGVLMHDVDVTVGSANASVLIAGYVDLLKLDASVTVSEGAKAALTRIVFMKGAK